MSNDAYRTLLVSVIQLHLELTDSLPTLFYGTSNLGEEANGRRLRLGENIYVIRSHTLLRNEHFFRTINNKVSSRIVRTFVEIEQLRIPKSVQNAKGGPQHNRHLISP